MNPRIRWLGCLLGLAGMISAPGADLIRTPLFVAGQGGYQSYRIPGIAVTAKGTLLAWCEARQRTGTDWSQTDLLLRRSEDGGGSWSKPQTISMIPTPVGRNPVAITAGGGREDERTFHNGVLINTTNGMVHLVFCGEYQRAYHAVSIDDGRTFAPSQDITSVFEGFRPAYDWKVIATGPGHGLSLRRGRLLVPVWLSAGTGGHGHRPSCIATIYSDDAGATWNRGDIIANDPSPLANPSESVLAEVVGGRVMINIRSESGEHRRAVAYSPDGATQWSEPVFDEALFEPVCHASLIRWPGHSRESQATLLFANPDSRPSQTDGPLNQRRNLTLRLSADSGRTWPVARSLGPEPAGYSDLAAPGNGHFYLFHEAGAVGGSAYAPASLTLVRGDLDWLMQPGGTEGTNGFVSLFNGRDLDGWKNVNCGPETWRATNGMIYCTGSPIGELRTTRMYQNFVLELEWRHLKPKGNAGVFVWADALPARGQPFIRGVEIQVLDGLEGPGHTSDGDVFPIHGAVMQPLAGRGGDRAFPVTKRMNSSPGWNRYRITCVDGMILHSVNGAVVTRGISASPRKGYICLESEGSPVEFRDLKIRELPGPGLPSFHVATAEAGFECLYNGVDLPNWTAPSGPRSHGWEVQDWVLSHDGRGVEGPIVNSAAGGDGDGFIDFRWTDGARRGSWPKLLGWVPSAGESENERPAGEWNRLEWSLRGNRRTVALNGKPVPFPVTETAGHGEFRLFGPGVPAEIANVFFRRLKPFAE